MCSLGLWGPVRRFFLGTWNMSGFLSEDRPIRTLREVLRRLKESYCGPIGFEVRPLLAMPKCSLQPSQCLRHLRPLRRFCQPYILAMRA